MFTTYVMLIGPSTCEQLDNESNDVQDRVAFVTDGEPEKRAEIAHDALPNLIAKLLELPV